MHLFSSYQSINLFGPQHPLLHHANLVDLLDSYHVDKDDGNTYTNASDDNSLTEG